MNKLVLNDDERSSATCTSTEFTTYISWNSNPVHSSTANQCCYPYKSAQLCTAAQKISARIHQCRPNQCTDQISWNISVSSSSVQTKSAGTDHCHHVQCTNTKQQHRKSVHISLLPLQSQFMDSYILATLTIIVHGLIHTSYPFNHS